MFYYFLNVNRCAQWLGNHFYQTGTAPGSKKGDKNDLALKRIAYGN